MLRAALSALLVLCCASPFIASAQTAGTGAVSVTLASSPNPTAAGVSLTSTVQALGGSAAMPLPHPSGTVTLFDGGTALGAAAAISPNPGSTAATFADVFGAPDPALTANGARPLGAFADFNGDGSPDLLLYGKSVAQGPFNMQIFASRSGGGYAVLPLQSFANLPQSLYLPTLAVLDVDGDGHLDLLFNNLVAYGKGDGTFSTPTTLPILANGFIQSYAVDVNGDEKLDIVAVNTPPDPKTVTGSVQFTFTVFRNDGNGTFTSLGTFPLAAQLPLSGDVYVIFNIFGLSFADLNGDGKLDILSQSNGVGVGNAASADNFYTVLNNGDGTFGTPQLFPNAPLGTPYDAAPVFADLNGDGKTDVVMTSSGDDNNYLTAFAGLGDGTSRSGQQLALDNNHVAPSAPYVQLGDFNLDGKIDAVLGTGQLALGNGDGTFVLSTPLFPQTNPQSPPDAPTSYPLLEASLLPGAFPSFVYLNLTSGANAVFTPVVSSSTTSTVPLSVGMHSLTAHYSGDSAYAAAVSNAVDVTTLPVTPTVAVTSSANPIYASQPVTFTATLNDPTITGSITFVDISKDVDNPLDPMAGTTESTLGTGTIANGVSALTTKLLVGGTHTILAVYGPNIYAPIAQAQLTETVNFPFAVNVSSTGVSLTASSGQTATATLPVQALGGFTGQVTFGCQGGEPTCNFSPATVNLSGTGIVNVTLTMKAVAATVTNTADTRLWRMGLACGLPLFGLLGFAGSRRRRILLLVFGAALCAVPFTGCSGGSSSSSASSTGLKSGTYPFYITATSGQNVQVLQGTLTVQ